MEMKQIASLVNAIAGEMVGNTDPVQEDLSNVVSVGETIGNVVGYEQFTNTLVDRIGRVIMVSREYDSAAPDILRRGTGIPFGSITEKIRVKLPSATTNDSWAVGQTWTPGAGWGTGDPTNDNANPFITVRPEVESTFYNGGGTFEVDMTFPTIQNRSAFTSPEDYRRFADTVENRIYQAKTVFKDGLTMGVIRNLIGEKLAAGNACIDILDLYNTNVATTPITRQAAIYDKNFLRYAGYIMNLFTRRLRRMSRLYNAAGYDTFTPTDRLRFVTLDMFTDSIETNMQSDTFHDNLVGLKTAFSPVTSWQGNGDTTGIDFTTAASINILTASGETVDTTTGQAGTDVPPSGSETPFDVIGVMFDVEAAWQDYDNPRVTSQYNARKEQTTYFYKEDVHYCNDLAENAVVFTIGSKYTAP